MESLEQQKKRKIIFWSTMSILAILVIFAFYYNTTAFTTKEVCKNITTEIPFNATLIGYVSYNGTNQEFPFSRDSSLLGNVSFKYVEEVCGMQKVRK